MFLICRKNEGIPQIMARAPCEKSVKEYIKYNLSPRDAKENYVILKTEEVDINEFLGPLADLVAADTKSE